MEFELDGSVESWAVVDETEAVDDGALICLRIFVKRFFTRWDFVDLAASIFNLWPFLFAFLPYIYRVTKPLCDVGIQFAVN